MRRDHQRAHARNLGQVGLQAWEKLYGGAKPPPEIEKDGDLGELPTRPDAETAELQQRALRFSPSRQPLASSVRGAGMSALPDPHGPWDRRRSLAFDAAVSAYEALLGSPVGRRFDRYRLFAQLYAWADEASWWRP